MLSQFNALSTKIDGRYATDVELQFIADYTASYELRKHVYLKLQSLESKIVSAVFERIRASDPKLLERGDENLANKWRQDTIRVLRYSAIAVLLDDAAMHQERFLFWFQTVMRAFATQKSCDVTYTIMQEVIEQYLQPLELQLVQPIIELNRAALGVAA
ncbi:MAG: hypothetical protein WBA57_17470 [Elainellaceae cyanobacterium]